MKAANMLLLVMALIFTISESFGDHFGEEEKKRLQGEGQQPQPQPLLPPPVLPQPVAFGRPTVNGSERLESPRAFTLPPADQDRQIAKLEEKLAIDLHKLIVKMRGMLKEELAQFSLDGIEELEKLDRVLVLQKSVKKKNGQLLSATGKAQVLLNALLLTQFARNVIGAGLGKDEASTKTLRALAFDSALKDYQAAEAKLFGAIKEGMPKPTQTVENAVAGIKGIEVEPPPAPVPWKPNRTAGDVLTGQSPQQSLPQGAPPQTAGEYLSGNDQPLSTAGGARRIMGSPKLKITPPEKPIN